MRAENELHQNKEYAMRYCKYFILFFCLILPGISTADSAADELVQRLNKLQSLQAQFSQSVMDGRGRVIQQTTGLMSIQRPGKFRWETYKPMKQLLIADGKHIWFYDVALQQVTVQNQRIASANSPAMLLSGVPIQLIQEFSVSKINDATYRLVPTAKDGLFQMVQLTFDNQALTNMRITDNLGQNTAINFTQIQINPTFSQGVFDFKVPRDIEVVRQ